MLYEMLDETLTKLEQYEKMTPHEIKYSRIIFDRLKTQIMHNKTLHWTAISLRYITAGELGH